MNKCSIVLPVCNGRVMIEKTVMSLVSAFDLISIEIIIIDDGSADGTWDEILRLTEISPFISGVRLSRSFGRESAVFAGLENARGDCVIIMDADMKHPPESAVEMYNLWRQRDYAVIEGVRISGRYAGPSEMKSGLFGRRRAKSGEAKYASDFRLLDRGIVDIIKKMPERSAFFKTITAWTGLPGGTVYYNAVKRQVFRRKENPLKAIGRLVDSVVAASSFPMQLVTLAGIVSILASVITLVQSVGSGISEDGGAGVSAEVTLILLIGGVLMVSLGIIGLYISKIYNEIKHRPRYIIVETVGELGREHARR